MDHRLSLCVATLFLASACSAPQTSEEQPAVVTPSAGTASIAKESAAPDPYPADLQWMLDRAAIAEDPDVPCLMAEPKRPGWVDDPAVRTRVREVRSDSYWLGRWARDNLGDRLAYALITYDWEPSHDSAPPAEPPPLIYEIAVTGSERVNAPPLGDGAADVPVKVIYNVPLSHDQFMARRAEGTVVAQQLLDTVGEGGSPESNWAVRLMVFSPDGQPVPDALAQCDRLRRAYRLPVLMEFFRGRATLD